VSQFFFYHFLPNRQFFLSVSHLSTNLLKILHFFCRATFWDRMYSSSVLTQRDSSSKASMTSLVAFRELADLANSTFSFLVAMFAQDITRERIIISTMVDTMSSAGVETMASSSVGVSATCTPPMIWRFSPNNEDEPVDTR